MTFGMQDTTLLLLYTSTGTLPTRSQGQQISEVLCYQRRSSLSAALFNECGPYIGALKTAFGNLRVSTKRASSRSMSISRADQDSRPKDVGDDIWNKLRF